MGLEKGFGDKQLRLVTFSWALAFWAFFHFVCDISNESTEKHESVRAAATFFITWPSLFIFFASLFNCAERVLYCNLINGICIYNMSMSMSMYIMT